MRLTTFIMLVLCMHVSAKTSSQLITFSGEDVSLDKVFQSVKEQTGFFIFANKGLIKTEKRVSLSAYKMPLTDFLSLALRPFSLDFEISENTIVIKEKTRIAAGSPGLSAAAVPFPVSGQVVDATGRPVAGATITVRGFGKAMRADEHGRFILPDIAEGATLEISAVGFTPVTVRHTGGHFAVVAPEGKSDDLSKARATSRLLSNTASNLLIQLSIAVSNLDELVVTVGYGNQKRMMVTGAVSTVGAQDLVGRPITQASQALYGLTPGVYLNASTGEAGNNDASIRIRGIGTLNDAGALILVDGIESSINNINPDDIETITILKDAASAAIYGSRAANGVILVTTKRGKFGTRPTLGYNFSTGFSQPTVLPDMVTDPRTYLELYREAAGNFGTKYSFTDADIERYAAMPGTDWLDVAFKKSAPIQQHALSLRGGGENSAYSVSLGYLDQDGIIRGRQDYKAYNIRVNLDNKINERLKVGTSLAYSFELTDFTPKDDAQSNDLSGKGNLAFEGGLMQHPIVPVYDEQGRYATLEQKLGLTSSRNNEQGILDNQYATQKSNKLLGNIYAEYEVAKGLAVKGTLGYNYRQSDYRDIRKEFSQYDIVTGDLAAIIVPGSQLYDVQGGAQNLTAFAQATYEKKIGQHSLKALVGYSQESQNSKSNTVQQITFESTSLIRLGSGGSTPKASTSEGSWALQSYFGRIDYDFDKRYLFEFNFRRDGSSRFGANNRYGNFPSFSAGWLISNEAFWQVKAIDLLKFRGSWGILGNQSSDLYPFATQVALTTRYAFNNEVNLGGAYSVIGNPDLKWEQTQSTNIGVDMGLFGSRLTVEADYFIKTTKDILTEIDNPLTLGISNPTTVNAASVQNKGWETKVDYRGRIGKVTLGAGFNVTYVKNVVRSINPALSDNADKAAFSSSAGANEWLIRGYPIDVMYGYKVQGIFQNDDEIAKAPDHSKAFGAAPKPGDFRIEDIYADGVIDKNDQTVIGSRIPRLLYGFNAKVGYNGFMLTALFQGIGHADVYLSRGTAPFPFAGIRSEWLNRWTPENPSDVYPRLWIDRNGYNGSTVEKNIASFWVQNRAYLRLKNVQLSYALPQTVLKKAGIRSLSIFVNAQNLLTFTPLKDFDPEREYKTQYATSSLPQLKIFTTGLNVTF